MNWKDILFGRSGEENGSQPNEWQAIPGSDIMLHSSGQWYYHPSFGVYPVEDQQSSGQSRYEMSMEAYAEVLAEQAAMLAHEATVRAEQPQELVGYNREAIAKLLHWKSAPFLIQCPDQNTSTSFLIAAARANPKNRKVVVVTHEPDRWHDAFGIYGQIPKWDSWENWGISTIYQLGKDRNTRHFKDTLLLVDNANTAVHYTGDHVSTNFLNEVMAGPPRKIDTVVTYLGSDDHYDNIRFRNFLLTYGASQKFDESQFR